MGARKLALVSVISGVVAGPIVWVGRFHQSSSRSRRAMWSVLVACCSTLGLTFIPEPSASMPATMPVQECPTTPSLRELAAPRGITIGALGGRAPSPGEAPPGLEEVFDREFALAMNYLDFAAIHPSRNSYQYDAYFDQWVERNGMAGTRLFGVPLVYHDFVLPEWVTGGRWTRRTLIPVLREWIQTTVARYRGRVHAWVVVNEPISYTEAALFDNIWRRVIGDDYIELAFRYAREADPDARLYLNETNIETADESDPENDWMVGRANFFYDLVSGLVRRGIPIDGIGIQMHTSLSPDGPHARPRDPQGLAVELQRYADLGLDIAITEWDIGIDRAPGPLADRIQQQAEQFHDIMRVLVDQPAVRIVHFWGVTDANAQYVDFVRSTGLDPDLTPEEAQPVLFDVNNQPKPAYCAVRRALLEEAARDAARGSR